jgi:hypothetical protein
MQNDDLDQLVALLEQCERDTARLSGAAEAGRLSHWRNYAASLPALVAFVSKRLVNSAENGRKIHLQGGLSLEEIVAGLMPHLFDPESIEAARFTLTRPEL